jgi:hypothetical protein
VLKHHTGCGNYTLRVEIPLYVFKSHSCVLKSHFAFRNYTRVCVHHSVRVNITHKSDFYTQSVFLTRMCVMITFVSVIITLIRATSHSAYRNHSCACLKHCRECRSHICVFQNHTACDDYTLRVEVTLFV